MTEGSETGWGEDLPDPGPAYADEVYVTETGTVAECVYVEDVDGPGRGQWAWRPLPSA